MPRGPRPDVEGALDHVIARGLERRAIFRDDRDHARFVERSSVLVEEESVELFPSVLLGNHFHLVLRRRQTPLGQFMRRQLAGQVATRCGVAVRSLRGPGRSPAVSAARREPIRVAG